MQELGKPSLIGVKSYSGDGLGLLKSVIQRVSEFLKVESISSVYQVEGKSRTPSHPHRLTSFKSFSALIAVLKVHSNLDHFNLFERIKEVEISEQSEVAYKKMSLHLLAYDDLSMMTPELTLPHPDLYFEPAWLMLAAEIWGKYQHPILKRELRALVKDSHWSSWGAVSCPRKKFT